MNISRETSVVVLRFLTTSLFCGLMLVCVSTAFGAAPSWIFRPTVYTHDPETYARVAQYRRLPLIEALPDQRYVTSVYRRTQTVIRGADGSRDVSYQTQSWGNNGPGLNAEWERNHSAWRNSTISGSYYGSRPAASSPRTP